MPRLLTGGLVADFLVAGGGYYWRFEREIVVRLAVPEQSVEVRVFGIGAIEAQVVSKVGFQIVLASVYGKLQSGTSR